MKNLRFPGLLFIFVSQFACQAPPSPNQHQPELATAIQKDRSVGGPCECCEAWKDGLPENLTWETTLSPPGEPGEPLEITGTIFKKDGKTPASDVILYVYHTDAEGKYSNGPDISTCAGRHGHLRGWMKTGPDGRFRFRTIRPASYPNTTFEQHIHPVIKEPGLQEYWIDEFVFDDDPNLTQQVRTHQQNRGGSGLLTLNKNEAGTWSGERNILLGLNVPGYQ